MSSKTAPQTEGPLTGEVLEKGFENGIGEYNCFLNVVLQALWHLRAFREKFNGIVQHECEGIEKCVHCSLMVIFAQYQYSEDKIIPPTSLRKALAVLYADKAKFQLREIDDAAEAFEAVLEKLHGGAAQESTDFSCFCISHDLFGLHSLQQLRCRACGATAEPMASTIWIAYAYTFALLSVAEQQKNLSFCQLLRKAAEEQRLCPNTDECHSMCPIDHYLVRRPEIFTVGMVFSSPEGAPIEEIAKTYDIISMRIDLNNIFLRTNVGSVEGIYGSVEPDDEQLTHCFYRLRGMICYYGQHYNAFFNSAESGQWFVFDDTTVLPIGKEWSKVKERCLKGHLQPSVLFYEKSSALSWSANSFTDVHNGAKNNTSSAQKPVESKPAPTQQSGNLTSSSIDMLEDKMEKELEDILKAKDSNLMTRRGLAEGSLLGDEAIMHVADDNTKQQLAEEGMDEFVVVDGGDEGDENAPKVKEGGEPQDLESSFLKIRTSGEINVSFWNMNKGGSDTVEADEVDIEVLRTSWLYRNQKRLYRFTNQGVFLRLEPDTHVFKEKFAYDDVEEITTTDEKNMVIRFASKSGAEAQYCHGEHNQRIISILQARSTHPITLTRY